MGSTWFIQFNDYHVYFHISGCMIKKTVTSIPVALVICDHCPPPPPRPRGMLRTLILCLQFPIVTSTLMGTASWQNHDNSPPQSVIILHCHGCLYQTLTFPPHYGDNVKVKSQHICQAIPALLRGLGEAVITNDRCIIHSLWCTSHKTIVFSHPPPPQKKKKKIYIYIY